MINMMKIALNSYSLRNEFKDLGTDIPGIMINLCHDLNIDLMEWLDSHINLDTFIEDAKRIEDAGIHIFALAPHTKILAKPDDVQAQIEDGKKWLNLAHDIGAEFIRVQVGDGPLMKAFPPMDDFDEEEWVDYYEMMDEAVDLTKQVVEPLLDEAQKVGVKMGIETHHSYSSNYIYMEKFNKAIPSKWIGWTFDIGNYENDVMRWKALEVIKNRVYYLHAKAYNFDANGFETKLDFPRVAKTLYEVGCDGTWSIEFEGKMNGIVGAYKSAELVRYSLAKAEGKEYKINTNIPSAEDLMKKYTIN